MHIRKNDIVMVTAGKDKGKKAKVLRVFYDTSKALVEGINYVKKHARKTQQDPKGGIVQREMPIHVSNLAVICPKCTRQVRVGFKELADGTKARVCKKCGEIL
jgi:large subunit ribosomal protein L24